MREKKTETTYLYPNPLAETVSQVYGAAIPVIPIEKEVTKKVKADQTWENLQGVSDSISKLVMSMAEQINASVEMVKQVGCEHYKEFYTVVETTNRDLLKFVDDLNKIKARHAGRHGPVVSAEDNALCLSIFEDYMSFQAYFEGVFHHTLVSFTEYALEAQDRMKKQNATAEKDEG